MSIHIETICKFSNIQKNRLGSLILFLLSFSWSLMFSISKTVLSSYKACLWGDYLWLMFIKTTGPIICSSLNNYNTPISIKIDRFNRHGIVRWCLIMFSSLPFIISVVPSNAAISQYTSNGNREALAIKKEKKTPLLSYQLAMVM